MKPREMLPLLAGAALFAGLALTLWAGVKTPAWLGQMARRQADHSKLLDLQAQAQTSRSALELFETLPSKKAPPLKELVSQAGITSAPDIRPREDSPAAEGWTVRSSELSFEQVRLADLARLIKLAAQARPPWRLRECVITASEQAPGDGRVTLALETLEKTAP